MESYQIQILNQIFEIEKKIAENEALQKIERNIRRIKNCLEESGIIYHDPLGEDYNETRTDCEASIVGTSSENLKIVEVIKPIIRKKEGQQTSIIQKAIVIVETRDK
ncbi:MAG: hypothetical protein ACJ75J_07515 [Cytophagaceae bacterium]